MNSYLKVASFCFLLATVNCLDIICSEANDCSSPLTQTCETGVECHIICSGSNSCESLIIESNFATKLNISCSGSDSCQRITINCQSTTNGCSIKCAAARTCRPDSSFTCGIGDCTLECLGNGICFAMTVNATLSSNYTCIGNGCTNIDLFTANPTFSFTSEPTNQPTYIPTLLPLPATTGEPVFIPSLHPTFHPTYIPISDLYSYPSQIPNEQNITIFYQTEISADNTIIIWTIIAVCTFICCLFLLAIIYLKRRRNDMFFEGDKHENIPSSKLNEIRNSKFNSIQSNSNNSNLSTNVFPCFTAEYERKCNMNNDLDIVPDMNDNNYQCTIEYNGHKTQITDENTFHIGEESRKPTMENSKDGKNEVNCNQYYVNKANEGYKDSIGSNYEDMYIKQPIQETETDGSTVFKGMVQKKI